MPHVFHQRGPYRQQSMLSRGSAPHAQPTRRWVSNDHESSRVPHSLDTIELAGRTLSRIASDIPESSGGSIRVELSPDSYGPIAETLLEQPPHSALDIMHEGEDVQVHISCLRCYTCVFCVPYVQVAQHLSSQSLEPLFNLQAHKCLMSCNCSRHYMRCAYCNSTLAGFCGLVSLAHRHYSHARENGVP